MTHIAICDDEKHFIQELERLISRYAQETGLDIRTTAYLDGAELTQNYPTNIDLIFLDIQMAKQNGLQTAQAIRRMDAKVGIIFLTSMIQYALEGYKYNAANFIVKPIRYARLKDELNKWLREQGHAKKDFTLVSNDTGKYKVFLQSLQYIETFGRNLMVHTETENIITYRKMKDFEAELPANSFVRCHTGYLINLLFVKRVERLELELITGEKIPISQPKRKLVMERLAAYWGDRL